MVAHDTLRTPKTLLLIGGPMGVGKSAVCEALLDLLQPGVYLDGDWCWHMRPFSVTDETKAMVLDNICAMLNRLRNCSGRQACLRLRSRAG